MKLTEELLIAELREAWNERLKSVIGELKLAARVNNDPQPEISKGLKVKHKDSGLLYTVDSVSMRNVTLLTPEGERFTIDGKELEDQYVIA